MNQPESTRRLGDFAIVRELGRGGMGVVYEARQVSLNRPVALKVLSGGLGLTGKAVQRFRREAEAAAKLHHTNIVPVYATGEEDGTHFYAMELIEGPSLDHVIRQLRQENRSVPVPGEPGRVSAGSPRGAHATPLPNPDATGPYVAQADSSAPSPPPLSSSSLGSGSPYFDAVARMVAEVADALDYAHQNGVIHRDIKPSNLLLSPQGRLSINDFGLARVLEQPGMTLTGEFVGTPAYTSPEQITAGRIPVDHRTDIYSLGATLYELLTLQPPFTGKQRDQILAQIVQKEPKAPRKLNKQVPVDLETICLKALEKDPDRRYQTAGAMAEDLRRFVHRFAIAARRAGPVERLRKWARRHPGLAAALGGVLLLTLAAGFLAYRAAQAERDRITANKQLVEAKMDHALDHVLRGDFAAAEAAIQEAVDAGAPAGWVHWRRGQIAFHRGQFADAVPLLESAVQAFPDQVAPHALLRSAYIYVGDLGKGYQEANAADRLRAVTPEDVLYKGLSQSLIDPAQGLRTLDEAVLRRDSTIARLIRAQVRSGRAKETSDLALAKQAQKDADLAKDMLPGNPYALAVSLSVQVQTALLLPRDDPDYRTTREQAERDARALADFPKVPDAVRWRALFLEYVGQEEAALEVWRRGSKELNDIWIDYHYILALYRRGEVSTAADVARHRFHNSLEACLLTRAFLLSELPDGKAEALRVSEELTRPSASGMSVWRRATILRFLGERDQARAACREARRRVDSIPQGYREWFQSVFDFFDGTISEEALFKKAGPSKLLQCSAHFEIGLTRLSGGDRDGARKHFSAGVATRFIETMPYDWNRAFLARIENDPTWPKWIPVKP
jgi:serine/threonine protein kinase